MGILIVLPHGAVVRITWVNNPCQLLWTVPCTLNAGHMLLLWFLAAFAGLFLLPAPPFGVPKPREECSFLCSILLPFAWEEGTEMLQHPGRSLKALLALRWAGELSFAPEMVDVATEGLPASQEIVGERSPLGWERKGNSPLSRWELIDSV